MSNVEAANGPQITMRNWIVGKTIIGQRLPGGGDFISAGTAAIKVALLSDILQLYFQARDEAYNEKAIALDDVKQAILHARGKKSTKAKRKLVLGGAKVAITVAVAATGATVGSIVPVAGTFAGAAAGAGAGALLSTGVTVLDRGKRSAKGVVKYLKGTRGLHREQAANCLLHNATRPVSAFDVKQKAAMEAVIAILGIEVDLVLHGSMSQERQIKRLAERMKSN